MALLLKAFTEDVMHVYGLSSSISLPKQTVLLLQEYISSLYGNRLFKIPGNGSVLL